MNVPKLRFKEFNDEYYNSTINEIVEVIDGDRGNNYPKENDFFDDEYCLFLNAGNVTKNGFEFKNKQFITKEKDEQLRKGKLIVDDIVLTTRGTVGNVAWFNNEIKYKNIRINSGMVVNRIKYNDLLTSSYLYSYMKSPKFDNQVKKMNYGSAQPQLTVSGINKFLINYPKKDEQLKVSNFMNLLDKKIELQSKKIEDLKLFKKGLLSDLMNRELENCVVLSDIVSFQNGKGHESLVDDNGEYILINSKFISTDGEVKKYCTEQLTPLFKNDIVMVMSDLPNGKALAKCYLLEEDNKYSLNQRICSLRVNDGFDSYYVYYKINRNKYYLKFDDGVNQTNLKKDDVLNLTLDVPSLDNQKKFSNILLKLDNKICKENNKLSKLNELKKGLMQNMFI